MSGQNQFLLYTAPDGAVRVEVFFRDETVWLTQKALAELFGVKRPAITKHLGNIFQTGELIEDSVSSILEQTAGDGKKYGTKAEGEYAVYRQRQDTEYVSDFDRDIKRIEGKKS
jgi:hypothetical protein